MPETVTIYLTEPIAHAAETITAVTLRSPALADLAIGAAVDWHKTEGGVVWSETHNTIVRAYLERCVTAPPNAAQVLMSLRLTDAIRLRDAMLRLWASALSAALKIFILPHPSIG